ncbi:hypothetical protein Tco_0894200, partial [Tanacetum coccineum]
MQSKTKILFICSTFQQRTGILRLLPTPTLISMQQTSSFFDLKPSSSPATTKPIVGGLSSLFLLSGDDLPSIRTGNDDLACSLAYSPSPFGREHPNNPEKHSRVWKHAEISNMCFGDATVENDQIEAIQFGDNIDLPHVNMLISKMKKLRWLRLIGDNKGNGEAPNCLSNELRYIDWDYYPASPFPDSFQATNLVFLTLSNSKQKLLWEGYK